MTLDKQTLIDKIITDITRGRDCTRIDIDIETLRFLIESNLPQEDTHQKTTVPNVLLYETGYKQGREDMKKEVEGKHQYRRFGQLARFLLTIPMGKVYGYASKDYILKIEKMPYMDAEKPTVGYVDDGFDERIDNKSSD